MHDYIVKSSIASKVAQRATHIDTSTSEIRYDTRCYFNVRSKADIIMMIMMWFYKKVYKARTCCTVMQLIDKYGQRMVKRHEKQRMK